MFSFPSKEDSNGSSYPASLMMVSAAPLHLDEEQSCWSDLLALLRGPYRASP